MSNAQDKQRDTTRETMVGWPVAFSSSGAPDDRVSTQIYDSSAAGAFLACDKATVASVRVGNQIKIYGNLWDTPFVLPATVRWMGRSETHQCYGIGVEFDSTLSLFRLLHRAPQVSGDQAA